jgi:hypothetical protein
MFPILFSKLIVDVKQTYFSMLVLTLAKQRRDMQKSTPNVPSLDSLDGLHVMSTKSHASHVLKLYMVSRFNQFGYSVALGDLRRPQKLRNFNVRIPLG